MRYFFLVIPQTENDFVSFYIARSFTFVPQPRNKTYLYVVLVRERNMSFGGGKCLWFLFPICSLDEEQNHAQLHSTELNYILHACALSAREAYIHTYMSFGQKRLSFLIPIVPWTRNKITSFCIIIVRRFTLLPLASPSIIH